MVTFHKDLPEVVKDFGEYVAQIDDHTNSRLYDPLAEE